MESLSFVPVVLFSLFFVHGESAAAFTEFVYPPFSASHFRFIDKDGTFLLSRNGTFKAAMFNPEAQSSFYLSIIHVASNALIWSANRDAAVSSSGVMNLTAAGLGINDPDGSLAWSTPVLKSTVNSMLLDEEGNLILLDKFNVSIWGSFDYPTDTIVIGQRLTGGSFLASSVSSSNFSTGDYKLVLSSSDVMLQWRGQTYWKLSMETLAYKNSNYVTEYMSLNRTGLQLLGHNGTVTVIQVLLTASEFQIAQLDPSGRFIVQSFSDSKWTTEFDWPSDTCKVPSFCGSLGLCSSTLATCSSCPSNFQASSEDSGGCLPNSPYYLPLPCQNSSTNGSQMNSSALSYINLGNGMSYFSVLFSDPVKYGANLSTCQQLCSDLCSCLGVFYQNSSGACYLLQDELGSIILNSNANVDDPNGYIKSLVGSSPKDFNASGRKTFPLVALVLLPFTGLSLMAALAFLIRGRARQTKEEEAKLARTDSCSSDEMDAFYIPGLPKRFEFDELEVATDNFNTLIGSGGFGSVYKGTLSDKSVVAVKKITNVGLQGKKDFCTEIAVIGNIHHANLVRLKGFCAQGRHRLLVYEYMNRGSLDRTLFGNGPMIEWQERLDIALGTARGLAYLHSGCDHKIIHCDVKPENFLLQDNFQARLSDFGLSKLLSPEQSSLFTTMRGTRGYLAPEWLTNSAISEKTDVYSFGMVLLELVSGRKNTSRPQSHDLNDCSSRGGGQSLSSSSDSGLVYFPLFALDRHQQGRYLELVDPRLEGRVTKQEVEKFVRVALCCVQEEPSVRPTMNSVVGMLEGSIPLAQPHLDSLNFLRYIGRWFSEASMIEDGKLSQESNSFPVRTTNGALSCYSYVSSQEVSGPR